MRKFHNLRSLKTSNERMYELIRNPVITEKATLLSEFNQVTFKVPIDATKFEVRAAVEKLFSVKVVAINTLKQKGKNKRFQGRLGKRNDYKKAVVSLREGDSIDVSSGI